MVFYFAKGRLFSFLDVFLTFFHASNLLGRKHEKNVFLAITKKRHSLHRSFVAKFFFKMDRFIFGQYYEVCLFSQGLGYFFGTNAIALFYFIHLLLKTRVSVEIHDKKNWR